MSSEASATRRASPANAEEWAVVAKSAGLTMIRALALIAAVIILARVRSDTAIPFHLAMVGAVLLCIYIALGTGFREWAPYVAGFILFAQLRTYADNIGMPVQYDYAIAAEKVLFLGTLPNNWLQDALYTYKQLGVLEAYTIFIYTSYFFLPHIVALGLWKWDRKRFRTFSVAFLITLYIGLITCAILPTAPPWLAAQNGFIPHVYQVLPDISGEVAPGAYQQGYSVAGANPVAAMPSLHTAIPCVMAIALWKYRYLRYAGIWYAASMAFSIVYLGEHYFVDAVAALVVAAIAWLAARRAIAWWQARSPLAEQDKAPAAVPEPAA